jgi:hypothetical protein
MAQPIEIATQGWGYVVDSLGKPVSGATATLKNLDGTNATTYATITRTGSSTAALTSNSDGTLPRFTDTGVYTLTVGATTRRVEATSAGGIYTDGLAWESTRAFRDTNKDGVYYVENFQDASGVASPLTYTKGYGQWGSKGSASVNGHGNLDAFWASYSHYGDGEVGLFIGDVTAKTGGAGGNLWGGHFQLNAEVAANMLGLHIELAPTVSVAAKSTIGLHVTAPDAFQCNNGLRVAGNFDRPIIVYSDRAGTTINFDIDSTGAMRTRGTITPLGSSGAFDLGSTGARWRSLHVNNASVNQGNFFGMAGGIIIGSGTAPSQTITGSSSALWSSGGRLQHQGDDMVVTTLGPTFISGDSAKGIVLKDNAGTPHYWRVTVSAAGALTTTDLGTTRPTV